MARGIPLGIATVSLALVSAAAVGNQRARQTNFRYQKAVVGQPRGLSGQADPAEQEALTREDILERSNPQPQPVPAATAVAPPQQPQLSQLQQQQLMQQWQQMKQMEQMQTGVSPPMGITQTMAAQQLLQAQAKQMQQMQQQLQKQQQELQRLQQSEKQHLQQQQNQHKEVPPKPVPQSSRQQTPKKSLVGVGTQVMTETEMETGIGGITRPKGWDQCLKFARFVKSQDVTGVELVRTWKSTCEPSVQSGRATERYKLMCNSLSGVVQPYAAQIDYDVEQLCDSVLAVFHDVTATDVRAR